MADRTECFVLISYDLHKATSDDYENFRTMLKKIGLDKFITRKADGTSMELPSTTYSGVVSGSSRKAVKEKIRDAVHHLFSECGVEGTYLISVSRESSVILGQFAGVC